MDNALKLQILLVAGIGFTLWILMSISMLLPGWYYYCLAATRNYCDWSGFAIVLTLESHEEGGTETYKLQIHKLGDMDTHFRTTCLLMVASTVFLFISWVYACLQLWTYKKTKSFGSRPKPIEPVLLGLSALFSLAAVSIYGHKVIPSHHFQTITEQMVETSYMYGYSFIVAIIAVCFMLGLTAFSIVIRYCVEKPRNDQSNQPVPNELKMDSVL